MADIASRFLLANLAAAIAVLLVLVLRKPARRLFGARLAYMLWLLVPLAGFASLLPRVVEIVLPAPPVDSAATLQSPPISDAAPPAPIIAEAAAPIPATALSFVDPWTLGSLAWLAGAVAMAAWLAYGQSRFLSDARKGKAGPAVVGVLRPRIVVPADFEHRFEPNERDVILAHETIHLARHDAHINALIALGRCVCWFNPMIHVAAHLARIDQELACDATVAERHPKAKAVYASALLKAQLAMRPLPLGCYWPAGTEHPLTERIEMLKQSAPGRVRRIAGAGVIALLSIGAGLSAWAAMPPETHLVEAPQASQDQPAPAPLQKPQWSANTDSSVPAGYDGGDPLSISGTVEKIDFNEKTYAVFVRAISISAINGWGSRANDALWELNPTPYWGDRDAVNADLLGKRIVVHGFNAIDKACASACQMFATKILMPKPTALPALSSAPAFRVTDFALHYDTGRPTFFQGRIKRLEFGDRVFDAYVETEGWGGNPNWLYQVRSEYSHPRADIEKLLLNQTIGIAGWLGRLPADAVYDSPTGVYGTEFQLTDGRKVSPAGDELLSGDKLSTERRLELAEIKPGEPSLGPALWEPGLAKLPTIPDAFFQRGPQAFDMNAAVVIDGKVTASDDDGWWVEIIGFEPTSTPGAKAGALWRVVGGSKDKQNDVGRRITARGYVAKDTSCEPHCRMNAAGGIWVR